MKEVNMRSSALIGTGSYLPDKILTNFDLEKMVETSNEWILKMTGISERRIADEEMATSDLSILAARQAIKSADIDPLEIDMIIVSTATPDSAFPSTACSVKTELELKMHLALISQLRVPASFMGLTWLME